jgi:hypothetical protein
MGEVFYEVILWVLRMSIPILIYVIYFRETNPVQSPFLRPSATRAFSGVQASSKQHFTIVSDRPLYEIHESDEVSEIEPRIIRESPAPSYSRELLLCGRDGSHPSVQVRSIFVVKQAGIHCNINSPGRNRSPDPKHEKEYLQSLLHFRAFKSAALDCASWERWNEEAQKILTGALLFGCNDLTLEVYEAMISAGVLPDNDTFLLFVKVSLAKSDLMEARSFLTQMSNAGFIPPRELVDQVSHRLSSAHKLLNRDAPVFVPSSARRTAVHE